MIKKPIDRASMGPGSNYATTPTKGNIPYDTTSQRVTDTRLTTTTTIHPNSRRMSFMEMNCEVHRAAMPNSHHSNVGGASFVGG